MSIGRRIINMARAELNSLLDRASKYDDEDEPDLSGLSADDIAEEIRRRREAEDEIEQMLGNRPRRPQQQQQQRQQQRQAPPPRPAQTSTAEEIRRAYAALEVPQGSSFETVRRAYRQLMRKYHPDHHTGSPEKQKAANEVAQRLTLAYRLLEKHLRK